MKDNSNIRLEAVLPEEIEKRSFEIITVEKKQIKRQLAAIRNSYYNPCNKDSACGVSAEDLRQKIQGRRCGYEIHDRSCPYGVEQL